MPVLFSGPTGLRQIAIRQERYNLRRGRPRKHRAARRWQAAFSTLLIVAGLAGAVAFGLNIQSTNKHKRLEPTKTFSTAPATQPTKSPYLAHSEPTHLTIDSVGIDVDVTPVGKAADDTIEMPPLFDWVTGWYKYSPTPGEKGPAIIVGHVDTYKGISVFWKLRDVQPGDTISVARADGSVVKFKVEALKQFEQADFPTDEVYGNIDHAGLRLITCGGSFDRGTESYTQNTVVFASMVAS